MGRICASAERRLGSRHRTPAFARIDVAEVRALRGIPRLSQSEMARRSQPRGTRSRIAEQFSSILGKILCRKDCDWQTLDDLIELVKKAAMDAACHAVEAIVCMMNEEFFRNAGIARQGWRRKEQTVKHLHTSIGDLALQRDTYQHCETGKCVALLFDALQITPHQRTSRELMYGVLETATGMSFRRAIDAVGAQICVQTAIN